MKAKKLPNPGSEGAIRNGCLCAVMDNHYGEGFVIDKKVLFWISAECPLHGDVRSKKIPAIKE